jgi:branched-chain amino acid transport system substrate-binding protein
LTRLSPYIALLAIFLTIQVKSQTRMQQPAPQPSGEDAITIGLLLPDPSHSYVIKAAELAIQQANATGGYRNRPFNLVVRTAEGFWGAGSKESVNLVYEDHVCAIIGSLDGRNGHLAEQVATKSHLAYIETYATEPTLSQAFVPWFMRVVPNDNQQAFTLLQLIKSEGGGKTAILSRDSYDTRYAVGSFTKAVAREAGTPPLVLFPDTTSLYQDEIIEKILSGEIDNLVIPFYADYLKDLILSIRRVKPGLKIYGTLHFTTGAESRGSDWTPYEGVCMVTPGFDRVRYTSFPDSRSAYVYDAVNLVINAVRQVGPDREAITDYLSRSAYPDGATGSISFDELGNRRSVPALIRIENGVPQLIKSTNKQ